MTTVLGRDWALRMAARFGGRLYSATFTHSVVGSYDQGDPSGSPGRSDTSYAFEGIALGYKGKLVDGERITKRDYQVMVLRGTIKLAGSAVKAALALNDAGNSAHIDTVIQSRSSGPAGNAITVEVAGGALSAAGELMEVGTHVKILIDTSASKISDVELLLATSLLVEIKTPSADGSVALDATDAFDSVPLAGGLPAGSASSVVPAPQDTVSIPPPGKTAPSDGVVIAVDAITEAFVTLQVRGSGNV